MSLVLEDTLKMEEIFVEGYEKVIKATDEKTELILLFRSMIQHSAQPSVALEYILMQALMML
jgi:hypothetical protein